MLNVASRVSECSLHVGGCTHRLSPIKLEKSLVFRYQAISTSYYTGAYYILVAGRLVYFGQSNVQSRLWLCLVLIVEAPYQVRTPGGGDRRRDRSVSEEVS